MFPPPTTPVKWWKILTEFSDHPNRAFVLSVVHALRYGLWYGDGLLNRSAAFQRVLQREPTTDEERTAIRAFIAKELDAGRYTRVPDHFHRHGIPFAQQVAIYAIKQGPKYRVISNLSRGPPGSLSVNESIPDEETTVQYDRIQDLIPAILQPLLHDGFDGLVNCGFKFDIKGAYRNFPLDPLIQALQVVCFEGKTYIDRRLSFGSRAGPRAWCTLSHLCAWKLRRIYDTSTIHGFRSTFPKVYVDDFNGCQLVSTPNAQPPVMTAGLDLCDRIGLECDPSKNEFGSRVTITGFDVDFESGTLSQPEDKRQELLSYLATWTATDRPHALREWAQLRGYLNWVAGIYPFIAPAITPLYRLTAGQQHSRPRHHRIAADSASRDALLWIQHYIRQSPRTRLLDFYCWQPGQEDLTLYTDASLSGLGCFFPQWRFGLFHRHTQPYGPPSGPPNHIGVNEMYAIFIGIRFVLRHTSRDRSLRVLVYCDNSGVVSNFDTFSSRIAANVTILRQLVPLEASEGLSIRVYGIATKFNTIADSLSRDPDLARLQTKHLGVHIHELADADLPCLPAPHGDLFPSLPL